MHQQRSKTPWGITILIVYFAIEGIFFVSANSIEGMFIIEGVSSLFGESIIGNIYAAFGLSLAVFNFIMVWAFVVRKGWARFAAIVGLIVASGIFWVMNIFVVNLSDFGILTHTVISGLIVVYLVTSPAREYFGSKGLINKN